jgi:tRNA (cytidine/uridine-2'-O-)-methyltransferase
MPRLALFQPDIPQNTGTIIRLCACLGIGLDIIEPCGFPFADAKLKRAGMDYLDLAAVTRHSDFNNFLAKKPGRLVSVETGTATAYTEFTFLPTDTLLLGRESAGTPADIFTKCDFGVFIPQIAGRSLNVAIAAAMVLGEALRQTSLQK